MRTGGCLHGRRYVLLAVCYLRLIAGYATPDILARLNPVLPAQWDDTNIKPCLEGTQVGALTAIWSWVNSRSDPTVLWLKGSAGTGKSTIARTVCQSLDEKDLLAASFFISRQASKRHQATYIVRSIAYQLARREKKFLQAVCAAGRKDPELSAGNNLSKQLWKFIIEPARALSDGASLVVVIDALDESELGQRGAELLALLIQGLVKSSRRLKFFITSREEPTIQHVFDGFSESVHYRVLQLDAAFEPQLSQHLLDSLDLKVRSLKASGDMQALYPIVDSLDSVRTLHAR
jgi:nucleoside-triphosphatase THEP1